MSDDTVYAIASGKGGVGKTTTTVNLGTALAGAGNEVVVVDVDLGMANLAGFVSLEADAATLHDVLAGERDVEHAVYELADNIWAVPSGIDLDDYAAVHTEGLGDVVATLRDRFDYVLLDVGAGISHDTVLPLGLADRVLVVSTPEPASIQDADKTVELTRRADGDVAGLVVTRIHPDSDIAYDEIADRVDLELAATIPEDETVRESLYAGTPLVVHAPDSPAALAYKRLAARVLNGLDETGVTHPAATEGRPRTEDGVVGSDAAADGPDAPQDEVQARIREAEGDEG